VKRLAIALDWVLIVGLLLLTIATAIRYPGAMGIGSLFLLFPFGSALIALNSPVRAATTWTAIVLNILLALGGVAILLGGSAFPYWGIALGLLACLVPGTLNAIVVFRDSRQRRTVAAVA
jgi:hypothetical protein